LDEELAEDWAVGYRLVDQRNNTVGSSDKKFVRIV
jgi:hypothetical protein